MKGILPIRSFSLEKQAAEERPTVRFCFMHVALGMDFQDKHRQAMRCVCERECVCSDGGGVGGCRKRKNPSLASVRSL